MKSRDSQVHLQTRDQLESEGFSIPPANTALLGGNRGSNGSMEAGEGSFGADDRIELSQDACCAET